MCNLLSNLSNYPSSRPLIILNTGYVDPLSIVRSAAFLLGAMKDLVFITLGDHSQENMAESAISLAQDKGGWVCLSNCHQAGVWMFKIANIVSDMGEDTNPKFRLILNTEMTYNIPSLIIHKGLKMIFEPAHGIQQVVARLAYIIAEIEIDGKLRTKIKDSMWTKIALGLCIFHAVLDERYRCQCLHWGSSSPRCQEIDFYTASEKARDFIYADKMVAASASKLLESQIISIYTAGISNDFDRECVISIFESIFSQGTALKSEKR